MNSGGGAIAICLMGATAPTVENPLGADVGAKRYSVHPHFVGAIIAPITLRLSYVFQLKRYIICTYMLKTLMN